VAERFGQIAAVPEPRVAFLLPLAFVVDKKVTSIWRYWWWASRALVHMTFFTAYVTDFILPVLLAVAAPIVNCWTLI
jgi:hypothetical protein